MGCMRARILKMEGMKMSTTNRGQAAPVAAHIALCQASKPQQAPSESPSHRMVHLTRCAATLEQVFAPPQRAPSGTSWHHLAPTTTTTTSQGASACRGRRRQGTTTTNNHHHHHPPPPTTNHNHHQSPITTTMIPYRSG